ncbi:MAG: protein translocase subunit SecF [Gammaproteobacteria bacterium]|nr:protein translocase subunit SecF [Gammaproteobacteria bacterium]MDE2023991.1 protein translocase subunit SecF [Gammaproteobacteria bacterium]MDE2273478.1 protein translocase subunit SecF [Gammaproteobacteria bacterium]
MEFFHKVPNINFLGLRKFTFAASIAVLILAVVSLSIHGLNFAVDFTGGVTVQVAYPGPANLQQIRSTLVADGYKDAITQTYGTPDEVLIRLQPKKGVSGKDTGNAVLALLQKADPQVRLEQVNFVGPEVGRDLATKGALAFVLTLAGILIYIIFRFEWRLAVGGVLATLHDVVFVVGFFSVFHLEFDLNVLAAVLAVMGYSVNDTVVVFDRIREDFRIMRKGTPIEIINLAINQTLSRTIITSGTTLLVVIALLILGGPVLHGFSVALLVGIIVGTYSSIYIASAVALVLGVSKKDLMVRVKEEKKVDDMP